MEGKGTLELKPLKTFDEMLSSPCTFNIMNFHTSLQCVPRTHWAWTPHFLYLQRWGSQEWVCTLCCGHLLSLGDIQLLPLWDRMSQITQPRSCQGQVYTPQDLQRAGKVIRFWTIVVKQLCKTHWNSCFFRWKRPFTQNVRLDACRTPRKLELYHNFLKGFFLLLLLLPWLYSGQLNPWVRNFAHSHKYDFLNLPWDRKEAKCDYSASKVSSCGDSSKELKVLHISELKYTFRKAPWPCCFHKGRKSHKRDFHSGTKLCTALPAVSVFPWPALISLCLNRFSLIFPLFLLPHLCCYPGNYTLFARALPSNDL